MNNPSQRNKKKKYKICISLLKKYGMSDQDLNKIKSVDNYTEDQLDKFIKCLKFLKIQNDMNPNGSNNKLVISKLSDVGYQDNGVTPEIGSLISLPYTLN